MPKYFELEEATIESVHAAMVRGELSCRELVEGYLDRIRRYDHLLNSVILTNPDVLEMADEIDTKFKNEGLTAPLHGIPVLVKDNIDVCGMPTTSGSKSLEGNVASKDAHVTRKLKEAGALILAKTNLHEFALWGESVGSLVGQTINPYDFTRTPGGSSGGTGAGIAANFGLVGIGTDTVNSVRSPASACSLVGVRPSAGLVGRSGVVPNSFSQDAIGPICRTVSDAACVLEALAGYDSSDELTVWASGRTKGLHLEYGRIDDIRRKRIGVLRSFFGTQGIHQEVNAVLEECFSVFLRMGCIVVDLEDVYDSGHLTKDVSLHLYELKECLGSYLERLPASAKIHSFDDLLASGLFHSGIKDNLHEAFRLSTQSDDYAKRFKACHELRQRLMKLFVERDLDVLVFPHQKRPVVSIGETQAERNGVLAAITGFPSLVIPGGFTSPTDSAPIGIPVGMELLGRPFEDGHLLALASAFEKTTYCRRPPCL